jgi:hypothetical protein
MFAPTVIEWDTGTGESKTPLSERSAFFADLGALGAVCKPLSRLRAVITPFGCPCLKLLRMGGLPLFSRKLDISPLQHNFSVSTPWQTKGMVALRKATGKYILWKTLLKPIPPCCIIKAERVSFGMWLLDVRRVASEFIWL